MTLQPIASADASVNVFRRMTRSRAGPAEGNEDAGMRGVSQPGAARLLVLAYLRNL
jgi:hypothetical protein